jgi:hypothetical protein
MLAFSPSTSGRSFKIQFLFFGGGLSSVNESFALDCKRILKFYFCSSYVMKLRRWIVSHIKLVEMLLYTVWCGFFFAASMS